MVPQSMNKMIRANLTIIVTDNASDDMINGKS